MKSFILFLATWLLANLAFGEQTTLGSYATGTANTTYAQVFASNLSRNDLVIVNESTSVGLRVREGSSGTDGILVPPGGNYDPDPVPVDSIWVKTDSSTAAYLGKEGESL